MNLLVSGKGLSSGLQDELIRNMDFWEPTYHSLARAPKEPAYFSGVDIWLFRSQAPRLHISLVGNDRRTLYEITLLLTRNGYRLRSRKTPPPIQDIMRTVLIG